MFGCVGTDLFKINPCRAAKENDRCWIGPAARSAKAALIGKMADVDALAADLEHAIAAPAAEASKTPPDPLTLQKLFDLVIWMDKRRRFAESFL